MISRWIEELKRLDEQIVDVTKQLNTLTQGLLMGILAAVLVLLVVVPIWKC